MTIRKQGLLGSMTILLLLTLWSWPAWSAEGEAAGGSPPHDQTSDSRGYDDCARFIAGLPTPESSLAPYEKQAAWSRYADATRQNWERFETKQLQPMREWASRELQAAADPTVFYPFSGPDFVNLYTLFPNAKTYLMVALEPVGPLPDFGALNLAGFFASLQRALHDYLAIDFFGTIRMDRQITKTELKGFLPVLLFFLAREQARVLEVHYLLLKPDGALAERPATAGEEPGEGIRGVRIDFTGAGAAGKQTLYYWQCDLQNRSFACKPQFAAFLKGFGPLTTFTKAASYLLASPNSSELRQFILEASRYLVQDDSGIPLKYLDPAGWQLKFYGTYRGPLAMFPKRHQPELVAAYRNGKEIYPLPFGFGYHFRPGTSNLLYAAKQVAEGAK